MLAIINGPGVQNLRLNILISDLQTNTDMVGIIIGRPRVEDLKFEQSKNKAIYCVGSYQLNRGCYSRYLLPTSLLSYLGGRLLLWN